VTESPLHILLANSVRLFAGGERFLLDAAAGLAARGHRVTVQAYPGAPLAQRARAADLTVHEVATRADGAPWQVWPLQRWIEREQVDVVLTNYEKDLRTVGWAAHLGRRPVAVVHSRECDAPLKNLPHYRYFYTAVARHVIANSEATRHTLLGSVNWLDPAKVSVLYKGIDVETFDPAPVLGPPRPTEEVVFGFAGQLVPRKRCDLLLTALAALPPDVVWRATIAGDGPQRASLEALARSLGVAAKVGFAGFVTDVATWMRGIDVMVLPSLVEGFGYVLAEAAACGKPAVAFGASSIPEIVQDGITGLLIPPDRPQDLLGALSRLAADVSLRTRLGEAARQRARHHFALAPMLDRLEHRLGDEHARLALPGGFRKAST
jgi:glycosyltransferase involved in cell wall biosynthesis